MNPGVAGNGRGFRAGRLPDVGFVVSWIGRDPSTGGYFFGSYDGEIRPVSDGFLPTGPAWLACPSGEAVNGIAVQGRMIAVSTRTEVYVHDLDATHRPADVAPIYDGGAHGIIATDSGTFVAPLGPEGLLGITSPEDPASSTWTTQIEGKEVYFLEVAQLATNGTNDVIAVAARRDGLGILSLFADREAGGLESARFSSAADFDAVSVCSMGSPGSPYAAAALGADLSVCVWRDARKDRPDGFRIGTLKASAYSISHAKGHLFVHTSKGVLVLMDVASSYLAGSDHFPDCETRFIPWEASDIVLIDDVGFAMLEGGVVAFFVADIAGEVHRPGRTFGLIPAELGMPASEETPYPGVDLTLVHIDTQALSIANLLSSTHL